MSSGQSRFQRVPWLSLGALLLATVPAHAQDSSQSWGQTISTWVKGTFTSIATSQTLNQLFGPATGAAINGPIGAGKGLYNLDSGGVSAFQAGANDITVNSNASGNGQAAVDRFCNQDVPNDLLNMTLPAAVNNIVPNSLKLYDQLQQWGNNIVDGVNQMGDKASGAIDNLKSYFSGDAGMQPGSSNAQEAQSENLGTPANISSTLSDETYQINGVLSPPQQAVNQRGGAQAANLAASASPPNNDNEEDYIPSPVVTPGPNSERDTDYSTATVASMLMQSSDPNSCIRTSNAMGIASVNINCDSKPPPSDQNDADSSDAAAAAAAAYNASQGIAVAPTQAVVGRGQAGSPTSHVFTQPLAPAGSANGSGCAAFYQAIANTSRSYVPIVNSNSCQAHRTALSLDQQTLQLANRYSGICAAAAGAISSTEATIRTESQLVNQACSH